MTAPVLFRNQLETLLRSYPPLQKQQYFSKQSLISALKDENELKVNQIVSIIMQRELPITEQTDKEYSIAYYFFWKRFGVEYLAKNHAFRATISSECLNQYPLFGLESGTTNLTWLMSVKEGISLLQSDPTLRSKITPEGLNHRITGEIDQGSSALLWLNKRDKHATLLTMDESLRNKITEEGLNSITTVVPADNHDNDAGISAVFFLALSNEGLDLLCKDDVLRAKISAAGLNSIGLSEEYKGQSLVYLLARSEQGRTLLRNDARLRSLIDASTLNCKAESTGQSAADFLCACADGKELLDRDPVLNAKVVKSGIHGFFSRVVEAISPVNKNEKPQNKKTI